MDLDSVGSLSLPGCMTLDSTSLSRLLKAILKKLIEKPRATHLLFDDVRTITQAKYRLMIFQFYTLILRLVVNILVAEFK